MRPLRHRIVALIAAYALALHTLLLAFAAVAPASASPHIGSLCSGLGSDQHQAPPGEHGAVCAIACAMLSAGFTAPEQPVVATAPLVLARVLRPAAGEAAPPPGHDGAVRARAPPRG